ncbi:MAG: glycoside hydrolase family 3 C-terminal domain-containing protein [Myxococcota bacterium]
MDVEGLLEQLTLDEKALLTAGEDMWSVPAVERLGVPKIRVTDGPNGARGSSLLGLGDATAVCIPCGAALGASWNPELIERVGSMLGEEARTKSARVLLAPTINLHRSPLGGRNFECYSEDPLLSGRIAAAFVRGVQSQGVATTCKHFVANDAEFERHTIDSVVDPRTLREIYLLPFEIAVKEGGALGIMTAYSRLNGRYCSEHEELLSDILRGEWGFEGFVVTDWFSAGSTQESSRAGLDLQMPGPGRYFGPELAEAVRDGRVESAVLDGQVRRMLGVWERLGAFEQPVSTGERSIDLPEHRDLAREVAADAMVLLRNEGVLPFAREGLRKLAVIGPNADRAQIMGGGSAALRPHYRVTPIEALRDKLGPDVEIVHERGCWTEKTTPAIDAKQIEGPSGEEGLLVEWFATLDRSGPAIATRVGSSSELVYLEPPDEALERGAFSFRARGSYTPVESGLHTFTLMQAGRARLLVDGECVLDGVIDPPPPGHDFFAMISREIEAPLLLEAGRAVELEVQYSAESAFLLSGVKIGLRPPIDSDLAARAEKAARDADAVLLLVGTNADWETEGRDRVSMDLPGEQDDLIRRVVAANSRTAVCVNTGSPVTMDWADDVGAILQIWFGGQEMSGALVDVLFGEAEPGGRLPTSFPIRLEHNPSFGNFPGENSELHYGEGLLVGYRWYTTRHLSTRFPFGHGLSYATFEIGTPRLSANTFAAGDELTLEVEVRNTGRRRGKEVVQCYVAPRSPRLFRPARELRAFQKVSLEPGESALVQLSLGDRAFAYWDEADPDYGTLQQRGSALVPAGSGAPHRSQPGWYLDAGGQDLWIGRSCVDTPHCLRVDVMADAGPLDV